MIDEINKEKLGKTIEDGVNFGMEHAVYKIKEKHDRMLEISGIDIWVH